MQRPGLPKSALLFFWSFGFWYFCWAAEQSEWAHLAWRADAFGAPFRFLGSNRSALPTYDRQLQLAEGGSEISVSFSSKCPLGSVGGKRPASMGKSSCLRMTRLRVNKLPHPQCLDLTRSHFSEFVQHLARTLAVSIPVHIDIQH